MLMKHFLASFGLGLLGLCLTSCTGHQEAVERPVLPAEYTNFEGERVAVMASAPSTMHYHKVLEDLVKGLRMHLLADYQQITVLDEARIERYKRDNPSWFATPPSRILDELAVDRLVYMDVAEFRPHVEGDPYQLRGSAMVNLRVVERLQGEGDPDVSSYSRSLNAVFPDKSAGIPPNARLNANSVVRGLTERLVVRSAFVLTPEEE